MKQSEKNRKRTQRRRRIRAKLHGTEARPRLSVFRSNRSIYAQLINDDNGNTIAWACDMKAKGNGVERAKTVGAELGKKALEKNVKNCIFDRNGYRYHGRVKALAEAAREAGLQF